MTYIEIACTGEKRQHTEASLLNRMAAIRANGSKVQSVQDSAMKDAKKDLALVQKGESVDAPRGASFRLFSLALDTDFPFMPIPQALDTGAWGKMVPSV